MKKGLYLIFGICLSIYLLLSAVQSVTFNKNHYLSQYEKNSIFESVNIDETNLKFVTEHMLLYLENEVDNLNIEALWNSEIRAVFSEREIEHMKDVKNLFILGRRLRLVTGIALVVLLAVFVKLDVKWKKNLSKSFLLTGIINYGLLLTLFIAMKSDFTKYFDHFHHIFFDNDLWMLDPSTEILVQILPEAFFYNTAIKIALRFLIPMTLLGLSSSFYLLTRKGFE